MELLLDLRAAISGVLAEQGKTEWAAQEFEYLRTADRSRRRAARPLAANVGYPPGARPAGAGRGARTVDRARPIAQRRDIAPRRILPDSAIIDAAIADPKTIDELVALPVFGGPNQRRSAASGWPRWKRRGRTRSAA